MKKLICFTIYLFLVFSFAWIYAELWDNSPDSFIVNDELNMRPFSDARNYLLGNGRYEPSEITKLYELEKELGQIYSQIETLKGVEKNISNELEKINLEQKKAYEKLTQERQVEIDKYREKELLDLNTKEKTYLTEIDEQEKQLEAIENPITRYPLIVVLGELRVEYANFKVSKAKKEYEVSSFILKNYGAFGSTETIRLLHKLQENEIKNLEQISVAQSKASKARDKFNNLVKLNYEKRISKLGYIDFVYYSIGISTTTTFGDIVANSKIARAFVVLQLILCVFVVGWFIGQLTGNGANKAN